jgi:hypothetical protein
MPTITRKVNPRNLVGATPWGNAHGLQYSLVTATNGSVTSSDSTAAILAADTVRLGRIPAGSVLLDSMVVISNGMTATITGDLGFEYIDGVNSALVPQDLQYFGAALPLATAARLRNATTKAPVTLPKDAWLTLTTAVATNAKASRIDVVLTIASEGAV